MKSICNFCWSAAVWMAFNFEKVVVHMNRQLLYSIVSIIGLPHHSGSCTDLAWSSVKL